MNNVNSDHGDPVIVHLRCLCNFSLLRYEEDDPAADSFHRYAAILLIGSPSTSFGLFSLGYFIIMVKLLLIREHLFVKGVCYPLLFEC